MVTIVKHEWHSHDRQYAYELDEDILSEIYPDMDEDEIASLMKQLENGEADIDDILNEASNNDVDIEWEFQYDDCWTDRKGGYEVTYEYGDTDSWHHEPPPPEPTHKCTKCKWVGQSYDADWVWPEDETGTKEAKKICPMCDSDTELTEVGIKEEQERAERAAKWAQEEKDSDEETIDATELEDALEELKREFEELVATEETDEEADARIKAELEETLEDLKKSTQWPTPNSNFVETAKWPFERTEETDDAEPVAWPFDRPTEGPKQKITETKDEEVLPNYPAGEYTIRIWGRTREIGVGAITKAQYDYWSDEDHEDDLSDAMNENFDYDEAETPEEARFDMPYYEYQDVESIWGFDSDDTVMTITNQDGEEIYKGDLMSFISEAHGDNDSQWDANEEIGELYPSYFDKGTYVFWTQGGKGSCIQTTIIVEEGEEFDPRKLKTKYWDIQGYSVTSRLVYDDVELDDEGMDSEHDNWRGQWSEFSVHETEE
jgi:hypothetical protein